MIEEGGIYKLKKIKNFFGTNTEDDFKVLKISGDTVYCQNQETKELNMFNKKDFIDPEFPDDIYSNLEIVWEKLNSKMHPMNLSFWKDLKEDIGGCVSASAVAGGGGMSALGAAPCPAMAQITSGNVSGCLVNGVPVAGKSVKKKKKKSKKNEEIEVKHEGILEVPDGKNVEDLPIKHFQKLIDKKGYAPIIKALTNLEVWNKKKNKSLSSWAENMIKKLQKKNEEYEEESSYYMDTKEEQVVSPEKMLDIIEDGLLGKNEVLYTVIENNRERIKVSVQYSFEPDDKVMMYKLILDFMDEGDEIIDTIEDTLTLVELDAELIELFSMHDQKEYVLENYIQSLLEDFNEDYEAITEQIAKYLDRLNFQYANTEDIIYKKEGENKYLFKFDNEIGIIKIKVFHNDDVLVEKEYEIDDTQDIQPIFDEIESIYKQYGL